MGRDRDELDRVRGAFLEAVLDREKWPDALRAMAHFTRSERGQLIGISGPDLIPFNCVNDCDREAIEEFDTIDGHAPEVNYRIAASSSSPGVIVSERDYEAARERIGAEAYTDLCRKHEIPHGMQALLDAGPEGVIGLATLRSRADGRSTADDRAAFARILPAAATAVRIQRDLEIEQAGLVSATLEAIEQAAVVLDARGRVREVTPAAEALIADGCGVHLDKRRLRADRPRSQARLEKALARALGPAGESMTHGALVLRGLDADSLPLKVSLVTLPLEEWSLRFRPRVIVTLRRPAPPRAEAQLLKAAYGLTGSEAQVAFLLAAGRSRAEVAAARHVSLSTVVTQLRTIFDKVGVNREAALVARVRDLLG